MKVAATAKDAYRLMMEGTATLCDIEQNGIRIDVEYCREQWDILTDRIRDLKKKIKADKEVKSWKRWAGNKFKISSNSQLGQHLFEHMGLQPAGATAKGKAAVDEAALSAMGIDFVNDILTLRKLTKSRDTYLAQFLREEVDGFIHPSFNLHLVQTYRSSSDKPNFQNIPRRNEEMRNIIRRAIIPRGRKRMIIEIDYGAMEVRIIACYTEDPLLCQYIIDDNDMHRDVGAWDFRLPTREVTKGIRDIAKNGGTFPRFYGSWWKSIAGNYRSRIDAEDPKTASGKHLADHIKSFEKEFRKSARNDPRAPESVLEWMVKEGEKKFWKQFQASRDWQEQWQEEYQRHGFFRMKTGHICSGIMSRNQLYNYPIQGTAFQCLLWTLVRLNRWMKKRRMGSCIIGQIHDSIVLDVIAEERDELLTTALRILCDDLAAEWKWLIVPLKVEIEQAPPGESWLMKKEVEL